MIMITFDWFSFVTIAATAVIVYVLVWFAYASKKRPTGLLQKLAEKHEMTFLKTRDIFLGMVFGIYKGKAFSLKVLPINNLFHSIVIMDIRNKDKKHFSLSRYGYKKAPLEDKIYTGYEGFDKNYEITASGESFIRKIFDRKMINKISELYLDSLYLVNNKLIYTTHTDPVPEEKDFEDIMDFMVDFERKLL